MFERRAHPSTPSLASGQSSIHGSAIAARIVASKPHEARWKPGKADTECIQRSFNGGARGECLMVHWFVSRDEDRSKMGQQTVHIAHEAHRLLYGHEADTPKVRPKV